MERKTERQLVSGAEVETLNGRRLRLSRQSVSSAATPRQAMSLGLMAAMVLSSIAALSWA
jgi:hypothetical protein